ncbi:Uncharacterised protein [Enterobacter cloacae]|nr:Uncharacterised protein [Enterobacter cloacae]
MREAFRLQPDAQILARLVIGNRLTVHWLKLKAGDQCAARGFLNDAEGARAFPAAILAGVFAVDLRFTVDEYVCQYAIGLTPGIQYFLARAEHFVQGCQQVTADDVVLLRFDLEAGVLLGDFFHRRQQSRQVFDVAGIGGNSVKQRFALIAVTLVAHVENLFELRVMREHAIVEMGGQFRTRFNQQGDCGFHGSDGLGVEHSSFLLMLL